MSTICTDPCLEELSYGVRWPVGASARVKIYYLWPRDSSLSLARLYNLWPRDIITEPEITSLAQK